MSYDPESADEVRIRRGVRLAWTAAVANAGLVAVKVVAGVLGNSYALIADGVESSLDILGSLAVWSGLRISAREADEEYHFGYMKAESLASATVAVLILAAGVGIAIEAVQEINTPHDTPEPFTLWVLVGVIVVKETLFRRFERTARETGSPALATDAWHQRSDALTSAAAFVGISLALWRGPEWASADDWAALFASGLIVFQGLRLLRNSSRDLMDRAPDPGPLERVREAAEAIAEVVRVEKVLARRAGAGYFVILHVEADPEVPLREAHALGGAVRSRVREIPGVWDAVIHMEPARAAHLLPESGPTSPPRGTQSSATSRSSEENRWT